MKDNRDKLIVLLLMVGLVVVMTFGFSIINSVNQTHQQLNNEVQFLHQLVRDMEYNISETINRDLEEVNSDIHSVDVQYLSAELDSQEVTADIFVTLKETNPDATYALKLIDAQSQDNKPHVLTYVSDTTYKVTLSLPVTNNYTFNVTEESTDGSKRLMSTVESDLPIHDELSYNRFDFLQHHIGLDNGKLTAGFELNIKDFQLADFGLQSVTLEVWSHEGQVVNQDITEQLTRELSPAMEEYYTGASMDAEGYAYDNTASYHYEEPVYEEERTRYYYDASLDVEALKETNLEQIEVFITVKMNDGVFETFTLHW
ncbi:hypothetical protein HMI01_12450 [Halolactibacillus miurensis]|uniref:Uncharacterized protein n=1 Tax=Halolactibacillus miurensis TaxID=306541 RepID=A0A1I6SZ46_9BACI|nr:MULTISPECIES: hypothetical protein [Halolactibacillus]GEM04257.1 hypothetical protein HMI01_12450 [Halolactibacillus miurensis]SFS82251.1 hypothetical protein SAMN05421668_11170 [Halolactibacillus miurensis]